MNGDSLGIIEVKGLTAGIHIADIMTKTAHVELVGKEKIGSGLVTILIRGDVGAVRAAVEAGAQGIGDLGTLLAAHIIPKPHEDTDKLLKAVSKPKTANRDTSRKLQKPAQTNQTKTDKNKE